MHSHILPGIDDGADDLEVALHMARAAVADGVSTMVATPHVDDRYGLDPVDIGRHVGNLNLAIARAGIALAVLPGAEIAHTRAASLSDSALRFACLGGHSSTLLIESPYQVVSFFEDLLFDLQVRGFRIVLAHPERSAMFQSDLDRLAGLVDRGIYCSVNAGALTGGFGTKAQKAALAMLHRDLVHTLASDCHDETRRPPGLRTALADAERVMPGQADLKAWLTEAVPAALVADKPLPPRPAKPPPAPSGWRRLGRRPAGGRKRR